MNQDLIEFMNELQSKYGIDVHLKCLDDDTSIELNIGKRKIIKKIKDKKTIEVIKIIRDAVDIFEANNIR